MSTQPDLDRSTPDSPGGQKARFPFFSGIRESLSGSRRVRAAWIAVGVVLLVVAAGFGANSVTTSPSVCGSCHEIAPKVAAWRVSPHAEVGCYECHETPRPWYRFPQTLTERGMMLGRDVRSHWSGQTPDQRAKGATSTPIPDATCEQCHNPARTGTSRFGVLIKHEEHAKRNGSCVSCHLWTAHQDPGGDRDSLMMAQCFQCHGLGANAKAPGDCSVCHLKGLDLHPDSHKSGNWMITHGKAAKTDRQQCAMCHRATFCDNCHGMEIPHPEGWAKGENDHTVVAAKNRDACAKCHKGSTNLCTMCHHKGYDAKNGPWVSQHFLMVRETGAAFCLQCHDGRFCVRCHATGNPKEAVGAQ